MKNKKKNKPKNSIPHVQLWVRSLSFWVHAPRQYELSNHVMSRNETKLSENLTP